MIQNEFIKGHTNGKQNLNFWRPPISLLSVFFFSFFLKKNSLPSSAFFLFFSFFLPKFPLFHIYPKKLSLGVIPGWWEVLGWEEEEESFGIIYKRFSLSLFETPSDCIPLSSSSFSEPLAEGSRIARLISKVRLIDSVRWFIAQIWKFLVDLDCRVNWGSYVITSIERVLEGLLCELEVLFCESKTMAGENYVLVWDELGLASTICMIAV